MRINHTGRLGIHIINSIKQYHYGTEHHNITNIGHPCPPYGLICRYRVTYRSHGRKRSYGLKKNGPPVAPGTAQLLRQVWRLIKCTGWQFVGYNFADAVVAVLLSIKY